MPDRVAACSGGDVPGFMMVGTHTAGRCTPIEVLEPRSGTFFERLEIRTDSDGPGRHAAEPACAAISASAAMAGSCR
jgi:N-methylhydantoinase B